MEDLGLDAQILAAVTRCGRRLLTTKEIKEEKGTRRKIEWRRRNGRWQSPQSGVYLIGAGELTWDEKVIAACLAAGETAAASHRAAARVHDIGDFGTPNLVEIKLSHETDVEVSDAIVHRSRRAFDITSVGGVPCTTVEDTLLDLASVLGRRQLHQAFTTAWRKRLTTPKKVLTHIADHGGRGVKGTRALRAVVSLYAEGDRAPGSVAEADLTLLLFPALDAAGIERPESQGLIVVDGGRRKVAPDWLWRARKKALEMMGLAAHGDYLRHDEDTERASSIRAAGFDLLEVTPRAVRERPEQTVQRIISWLQE